MEADTTMHVGDPKLRRPASEKACPLSFFSLVHRTTSQGGDCVSVSDWSRRKLELMDALRLCDPRNAGDEGLEPCAPGDEEDEDIRDLKRRSKGRNDDVGLPPPARAAAEGKTLLPGEDIKEP
jgi:hypothetical protein